MPKREKKVKTSIVTPTPTEEIIQPQTTSSIVGVNKHSLPKVSKPKVVTDHITEVKQVEQVEKKVSKINKHSLFKKAFKAKSVVPDEIQQLEEKVEIPISKINKHSRPKVVKPKTLTYETEEEVIAPITKVNKHSQIRTKTVKPETSDIVIQSVVPTPVKQPKIKSNMVPRAAKKAPPKTEILPDAYQLDKKRKLPKAPSSKRMSMPNIEQLPKKIQTARKASDATLTDLDKIDPTEITEVIMARRSSRKNSSSVSDVLTAVRRSVKTSI